jgi:hypothetical protein
MIIPREGHKHDGEIKSYTKDCDYCSYRRTLARTPICGQGKDYKILVKIKDPNKCGQRNRVTKNSLEYLDKIKMDKLIWHYETQLSPQGKEEISYAP